MLFWKEKGSDNTEINKDYPCKTTNYRQGRTDSIKYIVIHYVGALGSALANVKYYGGSEVEASAHFFVGHASENGAIYQSVDPSDTAWHCGANKYIHPECRNSNSIGIEICCHNDTSDKNAESTGWYFDDITVEKAVDLAKELMAQYGIDADHVIRHYDVTGKICPNPFVLDESKWQNFKSKLVKSWYADAQAYVIANGISDGTRPNEAATRAEVWQMIYRVKEAINNG
jgi:N-acetyl-anhydromuramyl-L-alanine amidase AmpD